MMNTNNKPILYRNSEVETLHGLFCERVRRSPGAIAYRYFDIEQENWHEVAWETMQLRVETCANLLKSLHVTERDRVAILMENSPAWVVADQAALSLNMITVPLFYNDRVENMAYVLADAGVRVLLVNHEEHWQQLQPALEGGALEAVILVDSLEVLWQKDGDHLDLGHQDISASLATIIYTSGTT
ncbi:MAG: AMP-binding protein, partial [Ghiorsea sp.]|nr:AMP-binding protein [Ghiorsea sp.]